jgi:heme/copper-type cytochrome/quinol oxidase subunit 1
MVAFVLYFFKEIRADFARTFPNIILLTIGLLLIVCVSYFGKESIRLGVNGWTAYPPLSALEPESFPEVDLAPFSLILSNIFLCMQMLITFALLYATFCWGRQYKKLN